MRRFGLDYEALRAVNPRLIYAHLTGTRDYTRWVGFKVELYPTRVEFKGDLVDAIRVRPPGSVPPSAPPAAPPAQGVPDIADEDLPF